VTDDADHGLLSPQWAGTAVAAASSDAAIIHAMVEVEVALAHAWERLGFAPSGTGDTVETVAAGLEIDAATLAARSRAGGTRSSRS
jgi:3-carboxy-cis,cis-muconate cycloisomerase